MSKVVKKDVGKIELERNQVIDSIDPENHWHLPLVHHCIVDDKMLLYMDKGEVLDFNASAENDLPSYFAQMVNIFDALTDLNRAGYAHMDVKMTNVVSREGKLYLIDFGELTELNSVGFYYPYSSYNGIYPIIGPEYFCFSNALARSHDPESAIKHAVDVLFMDDYFVKQLLIYLGKSAVAWKRELADVLFEFNRLSKPDRLSLLEKTGESFSLAYFFTWKVRYLFSKNYPSLVPKLDELIKGMGSLNVFERISIEEAKERYLVLLRSMGIS
ncbi:MAG: hypothetical protein ACYCOU_06050 [Sulfobacillus sp.]